MTFAGPSFRHQLFGSNGYNIPKPKFLYYVNFVSNKMPGEITRQLNFFAKRVDRIQLDYDLETMNQYNKKRLIQTKVNYGPLSVAFHDTTDSTALRMIEAYNRFYYNEFDQKNNSSWIYDITSAQFEPTGNWGLKANTSPNNQYFFDRVEVYEIFDQTFTQINFINPKFSSVDFQQLDQELSLGNEVIVNMQYEGIVVQNISQPITAQLSERFGLPFVGGIGGTVGGLIRRGQASLFDNILGQPGIGFDTSSFLNPLANTVDNLIGNVADEFLGEFDLSEGLNFGNQPNSILSGRINFDNFSITENILPSVQIRANSGDVVRDISTGFVQTAESLFDSIDSVIKF